MKSKILTLVILLFVVFNAFSQQSYFTKLYSDTSIGYGVISDANNGFMISGGYVSEKWPNDPGGGFVYHIDSVGNILDSIKYHNKIDSVKYLNWIYTVSVENARDGGFFTIRQMGMNDTVHNISDGYLIITKYNSIMDSIWSSEIHNPIIPDSSWVGAKIYYKYMEGKPTYDNGLIIICAGNDTSENHGFVLKLDSSGQLQWTYKFSGKVNGPSHFSAGKSIEPLPDSTYACSFYSSEGVISWHNHIYIVILDNNGNVIKGKSKWYYSEMLDPTLSYNPADNFLYLAYVEEYVNVPSPYDENHYNIKIEKLDSNLNFIWKKSYGNKTPLDSSNHYFPDYYINDFLINKQGEMYIFGMVQDDISLINQNYLRYLMKLDDNGDSLWFKAYEFPQLDTFTYINYPYGDIVANNDKGFTIITNYRAIFYYQRALAFRVDSNGCPDPYCTIAKINEQKVFSTQITLFPNPATTSLNLRLQAPNQNITSLTVYNTLGQQVMALKPKKSEMEVDVRSLQSGVYLVEGFTNKGERFSGKFVKE